MQEKELKNVPESNDENELLLKPITSDFHISIQEEFNLLKQPTLEELLQFEFGYDILQEDKNYYKCKICKEDNPNLKTTAIMKRYLYLPPEVLTITLKRFAFTYEGDFVKNQTHIEFPFQLNFDK